MAKYHPRRKPQKKLKHLRPEKMSVGWVYGGYCCIYDADQFRWGNKKRGGFHKNGKRKTLRTYRDGSSRARYIKI